MGRRSVKRTQPLAGEAAGWRTRANGGKAERSWPAPPAASRRNAGTRKSFGILPVLTLVVESAPDQGDGGRGPFRHRRRRVGELGFGDVQAAGRDGGAELDEDRAQVHLDGEKVAGPAAGHHRDRGDAGQAVVPVAVEERLEQAGVAGLVGGRGEDRDVRGATWAVRLVSSSSAQSNRRGA